MEAGPNIDAPSADHTWLPGCWVWQQNRYAWRPGYWAAAQPNWVWIPAHYVWTPRGYVFVDGYYDYSVARRGVLFAPVYFNSSIYSQRGFSYSPVTVINPAVFTSHLFLRPSYGHYYFGDYYGANYASAGSPRGFRSIPAAPATIRSTLTSAGIIATTASGIAAWKRTSPTGATMKRRGRRAPGRPSETAARSDASQQRQELRGGRFARRTGEEQGSSHSIQPVAKEERQQIGQRGKKSARPAKQRQKLEAEAADPSADAPARTAKPVKVKLPKTPIVAQPVERLGKDDAPPKAIEAPQPDSKIEPKPRTRGNAESPRSPK